MKNEGYAECLSSIARRRESGKYLPAISLSLSYIYNSEFGWQTFIPFEILKLNQDVRHLHNQYETIGEGLLSKYELRFMARQILL